jgi:hypothetical protein
VYANEPHSRFEGVAVPAGFEGCLSRVSVITQPGELPLPLDLSLAPDWPARDLFQRVAAWESTPTGATEVVTSPASLAVSAHETAATVPAADYVAPDVSMTTGAPPIAGRVVADTPARRYLRFAPTPVDAGARLFVRGNVHRGGLTVGLLEHDSWFGQPQVVTTTGPFVVGIEAPQAGEFGVLVSDASPAFWHMESHSLLRRLTVRLLPGLFLDDFELTEVAWYLKRD